MSNFSLLKALAIWGRLAPLMVVRLAVFGLVAVLFGIAIALGAWAGVRLQPLGGTVDAVLGGLAGWALALIAGGAAGLVVVLATTRLREDYLAIVTLGFAEVVRLVASNEIWLTRGTDGISGIPGPWRAALGREYFNAVYLPILLVVLLAVYLLMRRIDRSPYGRALLQPVLCDPAGNWTADYVRLRFAAVAQLMSEK